MATRIAALAMANSHRGESARLFPLLAATTADPLKERWLCAAFTTAGHSDGWNEIHPYLMAWLTFCEKARFVPTSAEHLGWSRVREDTWQEVQLGASTNEGVEHALCIGFLAGGESIWARPDGTVWP